MTGLAALFLTVVVGFVWSGARYWLLAVFLAMVMLSRRGGVKRLFSVLVFLMPFMQGGVRPELYLVAPFLEVILLVFFLLWFLEVARGGAGGRKPFSRGLPWWPFLLLAAGSAVAACAARVSTSGGVGEVPGPHAILFQHSMLGPFYPARALFSFVEAFLVYQFVRTYLRREDVAALARTVMGSACLVILVGLVAYFAMDHSRYFHGVNRAVSVFSGPNQLATWLLMSLPMGAVLVRTARERLTRGLAAFCLLAGLPVLYFTRSQGAWLSLVAVPLALVLVVPPAGAGTSRRWVGWAALVLGLGGAAWGVSFVLTHSSEELNAWLDGRYYLLLAGGQMVLASPLLGVGLGNFYQHLGGFYPDSIPGMVLHEHSHNMYLQVLAELGPLGLVLLLWPVGGLVRRAAAAARTSGLVTGLLAAVLGVLVHSLTDYTLLIIPIALLFWMELGMLAVLLEPSGSESPSGAASVPEA